MPIQSTVHTLKPSLSYLVYLLLYILLVLAVPVNAESEASSEAPMPAFGGRRLYRQQMRAQRQQIKPGQQQQMWQKHEKQLLSGQQKASSRLIQRPSKDFVKEYRWPNRQGRWRHNQNLAN